MKKIILIVVSVVIMLSSLCTMVIFALDSGEYTRDSILVDFHGTEMYLDVFVSEEGTILLPADILSSFGGLKRVTNGSEYIYSSSGLRYSNKFERQIRIAQNGSYGKTILHIPNKADLYGVNVNFKDSYTYDGDLFLPLEQIVPFLDATIEVKDGTLHISPSAVSIFDAITSDSFSDLFDSEYAGSTYNILYDISDGNGSGALSMFVDSIVNLRLDRLDKILHTGAIKDYKALFGKILLENDAYLSAFDKEETPLDNVFADMNEYIGDGNKYIKCLDSVLGKTEKILKYELGSEKFKKYQDFSDDIKSFGDISLMVDVIYKAVNYADVLTKMVDDHYNMLDVVYGSGSLKDTTIGTAANEVVDYYSGERGKAIKSAGVSALREKLFEIATKPVETAIAPYTIVLDAIKLIPGMDELSRDYDVFYIDAVVSDSRKAFVYYYNNVSFDKESLNNLRLSLLMTMVTSKYGYDTTAMFPVTENPDDIQYGSIKNNHRLELNSWVEKLYLAADSVERCTPDHYYKMNKELTESVKDLQFYGSIVPDIPENTEPSQGLKFTLNDDGASYSVRYGNCTDTDVVIPSEYNGKPVTSISQMGNMSHESPFETITIPASVTSIAAGAFDYCPSLKRIIVSQANKNYKSINGNLYSKDGETFLAYAGGKNSKSFVIPNGVTCIATHSLCNTRLLTSITIPKSVTEIQGYACYMTTGNCDAVYYEGNIEDWLNINIGYCGTDFMDENTKFYFGDKLVTEVVIPEGVTYIGENAFAHMGFLESVDIPDSVTHIGDRAFNGCVSLNSISIPASVKNVGCAFGYNGITTIKFKGEIPISYGWSENLTTVIIEDGATCIPEYAFRNCKWLTNISIPESVSSVGNDAFKNCDSLQYNKYGNAIYLGGENNPYHILMSVTDKNITSFAIPETTKIIYDYAFSFCEYLTSITIPQSVRSIGFAAFDYCTSLQYNEYDNCLYLGNNINPYHTLITVKDKNITSCVIRNTTKVIYERAFFCCDFLLSLTIPNSVTSIGYGAFQSCSSLSSITIPDTVTRIEDCAFDCCSSLTRIIIPDSVTSIGSSAFYGCSSLASITIPDSVTSIGGGAFAWCSSLTSITIPNSVTSIGGGAFSYCSLTGVTFENTEGWGYSPFNSTTMESRSRISSSDIANPVTAATYLTSTCCDYTWYYNYYWYCSSFSE